MLRRETIIDRHNRHCHRLCHGAAKAVVRIQISQHETAAVEVHDNRPVVGRSSRTIAAQADPGLFILESGVANGERAVVGDRRAASLVAAPILTMDDVEAAGAQGLPADLPACSYDLLRRSAERHGEALAISFFEGLDDIGVTRTVSYRGLFEGVNRAANMLYDLGIRPGDVVALLLPNLPETHFALWGAETAGIVLPLNPMLEPKALAALLSAAQAKLIIGAGCDPVILRKMIDATAQTSTVRGVVLLSSDASQSDDVSALQSTLARQVAVHDFLERAEEMPKDRLLSGRRISPDDVASYFCTGGTTGLPKIAVRTHGQAMANAWMTSRMLGPALTQDSVLFCGLPLYHINAVIITGLVPFLVGASVLLGTPNGFRTPGLIPKFWEIVERHCVTAFSCVPTLLVSLLEHPTADFDISSFRFAICGASPLSAEVLQRFERTCQISISEGYGMTEMSCTISLNPIDGEHRPGSVGLPLPMQDIRTVILDPDGGYLRDAGLDEIGVVATAGPNLFCGYLDENHNSRIWIDRGDATRWLNTGDLGRIDRDGFLWLTGRIKDLIIRGGHNIDPLVIEEALYAHPDVGLAAAVGRPDGRVGELPVAYVQLREGAEIDEATLLAFAASTIGERAAIPKAIHIVGSLPLTPIGKIHKPTLRVMENMAAAREALEKTDTKDALVDLCGNGVGGSTVRIRTPAVNVQNIRDALYLFSFPYRIEPTA